MRRRTWLTTAIGGLLLGGKPGLATPPAVVGSKPDDPLPSWNDGPAREALLGFVRKTTSEGSPDFVAPVDRIAVFDNDGTLWPEFPMPFEVAFSLDQARQAMNDRPALRSRPAYQAVAAGDIPALTANHLALLREIIVETHAGMTTEAFDRNVAQWIATARHPRFGRPYAECTYQPMQEVLRFLRASGYKTFIVSGGGVDFMRVWSQRVYGIPPEQVVGSVLRTKYEQIDGRPTLTILPEVVHIDDRAGKPVAIRTFIGKRPVLCFGNSDGDHEMLQYTTIGQTPSLGLIVHHTDAEREYAYDAKPTSSGRLVEALAAAPRHGWIVVDMKADWKTVLPS